MIELLPIWVWLINDLVSQIFLTLNNQSNQKNYLMNIHLDDMNELRWQKPSLRKTCSVYECFILAQSFLLLWMWSLWAIMELDNFGAVRVKVFWFHSWEALMLFTYNWYNHWKHWRNSKPDQIFKNTLISKKLFQPINFYEPKFPKHIY